MKHSVLSILIIATFCTLSQAAEERDPANYAGLKMCRICHKKEATGNQFGKWEEGPHSKTIEVLGTDEAKAVGAKLGINNPQESPKCLKCHSTAYHFTEKIQTKKVKVEDGVVCESCHGPGKNYKSKSVMKDREAAIAKGMIHPATKSCKLCHNDTSPTWKADRYTMADGTKVGFDVKQAYEKIKHPNPEADGE
ncbi:MAG: cytochrome C554 [Kiritimatiellae bacterium]|nr:cytochrome C554 [Kiritimatiellia bacterium]